MFTRKSVFSLPILLLFVTSSGLANVHIGNSVSLQLGDMTLSMGCTDITVAQGGGLALDSGQIINCGNLTLDSGAMLNDGTGYLSMNGNWTNNSIFMRNLSLNTIRFTSACSLNNNAQGSGDTDNDGLNDSEEGIDDTNGDGWPDFLIFLDSDGDGVTDRDDNCAAIANPAQKNYGNDETGDLCDADDDNDGFPDILDAFPLNENEWNDNDTDGIGDNSDPDDDNDSILDNNDNCPFISNHNQADSNGNGVGNVCDMFPWWLFHEAITSGKNK
ncbi:MAG: hypothetical protein GY703_10010 [Gammaproteobacteria bacterium]|nr:hypothetical protein [Gammaproteobacteria bacterium]